MEIFQERGELPTHTWKAERAYGFDPLEATEEAVIQGRCFLLANYSVAGSSCPHGKKMYSGQAIVLRNLRQIPPNTAKVIRLQKQFIEAVQRYQELNERPDKDEAILQELLNEISFLDKSQREELKLVREAEINYISQEIQNDLFCPEKLSDDYPLAQNGETNEPEEESPLSQEIRITGTGTSPEVASLGNSDDGVQEPADITTPGDVEEEQEPVVDETPMDWEDLTREQWSESDRLLQKVERVGSKVLQRDFLSTVDLVHVSHYKKAEEALALRKQKAVQGKKVITTGPWQIIDIPTKVSNRRCNYLTGLHVTVRQKDPKRSVLSNNSIESGGVKTRHHDSRGSSRASSRASSPIFSQMTESYNGKDCHATGTNTKLLRSIKTRATKAKKAPPPPSKNNNNNYSNATKSSPVNKTASSSSNSSIKSEPADINGKNSSRALEPCVTYTLVDGVPHFKVFFPSSKDSITSPAAGGFPKTATNGSSFTSPRASIVESDIEIIQTSQPSMENGSSPRITPERKIKPTSKPIKRPRLSHQGFNPSTTPIKAGPSVTEAIPSITITKSDETGNKEDLGRCIEKCGSWMGAPHFKFYRTFPSVNSTVASSNWSGSSNSTVTTAAAPKPVVIAPAPKLSSPISTPKLAIAPNKSSTPTTPTTPLPAMPKLTIGNQALKSAQPTTPSNPQGGKFVPIAPKVPNLTGGVSNFVIVPFADKNNANQPTGIKRPISLLKTCPPLSNSQHPSSTGTFLTVKNLKECLQNNKQYKDMKVVVQKVPVPVSTGPAGHQPSGPRLPLADSDDLKKKVVKLFPVTDGKEQANGDETPHHPSPTVIVADMSI